MPLINRVGGGGGSADLKTLTATPSAEQQVFNPPDGYDGFSKVTVKAEKMFFGNANNICTGTNGGKTLVIDRIRPYAYDSVPTKLANILHMVVLTYLSSSTYTENCYHNLVLLFTRKTNTTFNTKILSDQIGGDGRDTSVQNPPTGTFPGTVTYDSSANTLTLQIDDTSNYRFVQSKYDATIIYRDNG